MVSVLLDGLPYLVLPCADVLLSVELIYLFIYLFVIPVFGPQPSPTLDATMWNWKVFFNCFALL